ncbi:hypothetical protein KR084_001338 [Drosophila pseudotakahashii]|nr:hypothetical protein KR084_001338 [Drosophila pseudotakahashii]
MIGISFFKIFLVAAILSLMLGSSFGETSCGRIGYCVDLSNPCPQIPGTCEHGEKCCQDLRPLPSIGKPSCGTNGYCAEPSFPCLEIDGDCVGESGGKCCHNWQKAWPF